MIEVLDKDGNVIYVDNEKKNKWISIKMEAKKALPKIIRAGVLFGVGAALGAGIHGFMKDVGLTD